MSRRTALGQVLGHGSAKEGVGHWRVQRLTSVALVPLGAWFVLSLAALPALDYPTVTGWIHGGTTALLLILLVATSAWHSQLGVQVVVEDYVHARGWKTLLLTLATFVHVLVALVGVFAVLRIALRSAA